MVFWNRRSVRILVGVLLLGAAILTLLPSLTGYTSLDGTVNAYVTIVSAPIEGTVTSTPARIGTPLPAGTELLGIRNDRIARTSEVQIEADLAGTKERLSAVVDQRARITALRHELQERWREYQQAIIRNLAHEITVRGQRISSAAAQQQAAEADFSRKQRLGTTGVVAEASVEQARAVSITAGNEGSIARAELERLNQQLEAVKRGIFIGEGRNDVPYSQQRIDEVTIQLAELEFRERDLKARLEQLEIQLEQERLRNRALRYAVLRTTLEGVIWRNNVVEGSHVIAGNELVQVLDCRDLFVDILVSEVDYDEIFPGRQAEIRLLGRSDVISGEVLSVRGSAAVVEDVVLAAKPPQSRGRDARIRVSLPEPSIHTDYANFCQVGRSAQVRFKTRSLPLVRWFKALWFSIT